MSKNDYNRSELIKTLRDQQLKEHYVYDGIGRKSAIVQTRTNAKQGDLALVTYYKYEADTTRVIGMREDETQWDSSWDIEDSDLPTLV